MPTDPPKISLYSLVICTSSRCEVAPISGLRVGVIDRFIDEQGVWMYRVSESKSSRTFTCREEELQSVAAQPLVSDDELIQDVVLQTAEFRYSTRSQGLRRLVARKGFDPMRCLLVGCDQGDDVNVSLVLPDGTLVDADYREDPQTRQASEFTRWRTDSSTDRDIELCRQIIRSANLAELDSQVCRAFHSYFAATDRRLPAIE